MSMNERTGLEMLSEEECWSLLATKSVGRLAISIMNQPDIFPVNYALDGLTLVVRSAPGLKLAGATLGDGVAFEVDDLDEDAHTGWSIVVRGEATEIEVGPDRMAAEELPLQPWAESEKSRYFRITPTMVTGRSVPR